MNDRDAHQALTDTARLRLLPSDGLEDTQRMTVVERRQRQTEGSLMQQAQWPQPRERRKPNTVGRRALAAYTPVEWQQAYIDFINQGSGPT